MNTRSTLRSRGTTIVETAVVLPLLLILTFGALKYGWLFFKWQQITNITRHAARIAILPGNRSGEVAALISTRLAECGIPANGVSISVPNGWNPGVGNELTLEISVPAANVDILRLKGPLIGLPTPTSLTARVVMSKEGP
ncbi:MAG TPA: pilus assembly protein [Anaerohalosphaeraceae bacterium]|nr:pilus assembly protein [Phycisphaerae bacterium]HOK96982.1 pilus assembly protein [Anaerohalosphaeraceae bacterium]HOL30391.1 pilus assembly protein [Anaerohalosphaeraceae bacterium]HPO71015.1 pilus assembly protein [Anaerohalosphaeraceae bacterium]